MEEHKEVKITDGFDEGQKCFVIDNSISKYYFQKESGGFSSIHDRDGIDWINFKATAYGMPGDTGGIFRGIPNMVWPDNIGHPGHKKVKSTIIDNNKIYSVSNNKLWEWQWSFYKDRARLDIIKTAPDRQYWFLYEGTQGGRFDPFKSFWGTENNGRRNDTPAYILENPPPFYDYWKMIYFGFKDVPRVFYAVNHASEKSLNLFSYVGSTNDDIYAPDGMTVFGFGRASGPKPLLEGPASFTIGFLEIVDHDEIINFLSSLE